MADCECKYCKRGRAFREHLNAIPESNQEPFQVLYDVLLETELDLEYYKSLVDGSWPDADEAIAQHRKRTPDYAPATDQQAEDSTDNQTGRDVHC